MENKRNYLRFYMVKYETIKILCIMIIFFSFIYVSCKYEPPEIPSTPSGPTTGFINEKYDFVTSTTDPNDPSHPSFQFQFDWGDGSRSDWEEEGIYWINGSSVRVSHVWGLPGT